MRRVSLQSTESAQPILSDDEDETKEPNCLLLEPDFQLMQALMASQQNFTISDPSMPDNPIVYASQASQSIDVLVAVQNLSCCVSDLCVVIMRISMKSLVRITPPVADLSEISPSRTQSEQRAPEASAVSPCVAFSLFPFPDPLTRVAGLFDADRLHDPECHRTKLPLLAGERESPAIGCRTD